jgi:hypothetical protein
MVQSSINVPRGTKSLDVEAFLTWVYRDQKAHVVVERGAGLHVLEREAAGLNVVRVAADGVSNVAEAMAVGAIIRGSGLAAMSGALHADAETTHRIVSLMPSRARSLVIASALVAARPDWKPEACHRFVVVPTENGKLIRHDYDRNRNKLRSWCTVIEVDNPDDVKIFRTAYELWHATLGRIADHLTNNRILVDHRLGQLLAPAAPWEGEGLRRAS